MRVSMMIKITNNKKEKIVAIQKYNEDKPHTGSWFNVNKMLIKPAERTIMPGKSKFTIFLLWLFEIRINAIIMANKPIGTLI